MTEEARKAFEELWPELDLTRVGPPTGAYKAPNVQRRWTGFEQGYREGYAEGHACALREAGFAVSRLVNHLAGHAEGRREGEPEEGTRRLPITEEEWALLMAGIVKLCWCVTHVGSLPDERLEALRRKLSSFETEFSPPQEHPR